MLFKVALVSVLSALVAAIPRKNPYASFLSSAFVFDRTKSVAEIPSPQIPGGEFMGRPLDYGGSLDFGKPLSDSVGKLKVLTYDQRFNNYDEDTFQGAARYGKPVVKPHAAVHDTKAKKNKLYGPIKKWIPAVKKAQALQNDIVGSLEDKDFEESAQNDYSQSYARYELPQFEFANPVGYPVFF
ncbi:uncharacterized protein LOC135396166 [Ornithodoros turicata]|uniref:uncharacterized protein LOC135396166 n=1 Tax=Ornithodoros turicata TaxID=34597 RepID=UPI0031397884